VFTGRLRRRWEDEVGRWMNLAQNYWWALALVVLKFQKLLPDAKSCDSSVGITLGYGLDNRGSRVRFLAGIGIFLFITASRMALGPTQPPIQWVPGALSLGIKRPGYEADHSPPSTAEVKECMELYLHSPNMSSWRGA
jgi:hypothetical protein